MAVMNKIYRRTSGQTTWNFLAGVAGTVDNYVDASGYPGVSYEYRVEAVATSLTVTQAIPASEIPDYNYYVSATGNDTADGLTENTSWATLAKVQELYDNMSDGDQITVGILAGTYEGSISTPLSFNSYSTDTRLSLHCHGKVIFDNTNVVGADPDTISFLDAGGSSSCSLYLYGETTAADRTEIVCGNVAHANNGLGSSDSGKLYAYNLDVHGYYDGVSSHNTSYIYLYDVKAYDCGKSGFAMVNSSTYQFDDCVFEGMQGMVLSPAYSEIGTSGVLNDCEMYYASGVTDGSGLVLRSATLNRCRVGKIVQGDFGANFCSMEETTLNDCLLNLPMQHYLNTTLNNCYGYLTIRPRGPLTDTMSIKNCAFKPYAGSDFVLFNYHADPNDVGGAVSIVDSILMGDFNLSGNATRIDYVDTNWTLDYLNYHNYSLGGINTPANSQTSDPLVLNPTTENQEDWYVEAGSSCLGAASDGGDIGLISH